MQRTVCVLIYFKILFIKYAHKYMVCALKVGIATSVYIYIYMYTYLFQVYLI